ncbi:hypothetical protein [Pseudomonas frederiksbergensis]|uniref:hypothetical protein n=1 Tax=Pseudomonas frederiksbergensis TaxID=104087 RepID=UPI003D1AB8EF
MPLIFASLPSIIVCSEGQHICPIRKLLKRVASPILAEDTFSAHELEPSAAEVGQQASIKKSLPAWAIGLLGSARAYKVEAGVTVVQLDVAPSKTEEQQPVPSALVGAGLTSKAFGAQQLPLGEFWRLFVSQVVAAGAQQPVSAAGSKTSTPASLFVVCSSPQQLFISKLSTSYGEE